MAFGYIMKWWFISVILGLLAFPISFYLFRKSYEKGWLFSKVVAIFIVSYFSWILGFFNYSLATILIVILLMTGFSVYLFLKMKNEIFEFMNEKPAVLIISELFYLFIFIGYALFRSYQPDIIGTEKFMDFAFMNSITRADKMPPFDPWMAGETFKISYYYFGYFIMSVMMKLVNIPNGIAYNLALTYVVGLSALAMVGLGYNLTKNFLIGFLAAAFLLLISNIDGFIQVVRHGLSFNDFNWWHTSRIIDYKDYDTTINEFPFFSFLLGDIHPHQMAIPFVLLALNIALCFIKYEDKNIFEKNMEKITFIVFAGLVVGGLWFLNSWDFPTYFFIMVLSILSYKFSSEQKVNEWMNDALISIGLILGIGIVAYLPFTLFFKSQASGIGITKANTQIKDYVTIFGIMLFPILSFLVFRILNWIYAIKYQGMAGIKTKKRNLYCPRCSFELREGKLICGQCGYKISGEELMLGGIELPIKKGNENALAFFKFLVDPVAFKNNIIYISAAIVAAISLIFLIYKSIIDKPNYGFFSAVMLIILSIVFLLAITKVEIKENQFVILLIFTGFLLSLGCEFLHIRDTFGKAGEHSALERMNTVFKFYYQTWILFSVAAAYGFFWVRHFYLKFKPAYVRAIWNGAFIFLIFTGLFYPVAASVVKTDGFKGYVTLDGSEFLETRYPGDYQAIQWIKANIKDTPIILEAHGAEYTEYARISSFTGLPTVLGWPGHELQWRGTWDEQGKRMADIDKIYTTTDINEAQSLIKKYNIKYVYVGILEKIKPEYRGAPKEAFDKFAQFMDVVYMNKADTVIYKTR